jgi:hypothetical protein
MSSGFPGFLDAPNRAPNFIIYKGPGTYSFTAPGANGFIIDVFGAGGSGGASVGSPSGGGGGARHRVMFGTKVLKSGGIYPVIVGAGGASVSAGSGGLAGGKSSFGSISSGTLIEAYGGGAGNSGGASVAGGGGGIASAGNSTANGLGGNPNIRTATTAIANLNLNATNDFGGGNADNANASGNATWGGGAGGASGISPGNSLFGGGGGGGGFAGSFGAKTGVYGNILNASAVSVDGVLHALLGGGGSGGAAASGTGLNGVAGGFPGGGGGSTDSAGGFSGKGGDGLVVIYWW